MHFHIHIVLIYNVLWTKRYRSRTRIYFSFLGAVENNHYHHIIILHLLTRVALWRHILFTLGFSRYGNLHPACWSSRSRGLTWIRLGCHRIDRAEYRNSSHMKSKTSSWKKIPAKTNTYSKCTFFCTCNYIHHLCIGNTTL